MTPFGKAKGHIRRDYGPWQNTRCARLHFAQIASYWCPSSGLETVRLMRGMWFKQIEEREVHTRLEEAGTTQTGNRPWRREYSFVHPWSFESCDITCGIAVQTGFCTSRRNAVVHRTLYPAVESPLSPSTIQYRGSCSIQPVASRLVRDRGRKIVRSALMDRHRQTTKIGHSYRAELDKEGSECE